MSLPQVKEKELAYSCPDHLKGLKLPDHLCAERPAAELAEAESKLETALHDTRQKERHNARMWLVDQDFIDEEVFWPKSEKKAKKDAEAAPPPTPKALEIVGAPSEERLSNHDAETQVCAGCLAHPDVVAGVEEIMSADHCHGIAQRRLLRVIEAQAGEGKPLDPLLIRFRLSEDPTAVETGTVGLLDRVLEMKAPNQAVTLEFARLVRKLADQRSEWTLRRELLAEVSNGRQRNGVLRQKVSDLSEQLEALEQNRDPSPSLRGWPEPAGEAAYHGVAGEILRAVDPVTEADPMAILFQFLTIFGNLAGRNPCHHYERDRHGMNLFMVLVGPSTIGCKGGALNQALAVIEGCDPEWTHKTGLVSGEGLTHTVRDPSHKIKSKEHQLSLGSQFDPGAEDKRALFIEREFSSVLTVRGRKGGTLTENLRLAWSGDPLGVCSKNSPSAAAAHHISLIGHITPAELLAKLWGLDKENGVANRFLWICCRKSKVLPPTLTPRPVKWRENGVQEKIDAAIRFARSESKKRDDLEIPLDNRDDTAINLWSEHYAALENPGAGLLGALKARAKPLVKRLALIYAVLDRSSFIKREHLAAALALWDFNCRSIDFIFGDPLVASESIEDRICRAIADAGPEGLGQYEISRKFFRGDSKACHLVLWKLIRDGKIRELTQNTGGKPRQAFVGMGHGSEI
jgi:hypothetical protein